MTTRRFFVASLLVLTAYAYAEVASRYETRRIHDPDGIGKFYMDREIAQVMGPGGMPWLERPEREDLPPGKLRARPVHRVCVGRA